MREISFEQYCVLLGLKALVLEHEEHLRVIENTALVLTDEKNKDGTSSIGGTTADILWGNVEVEKGLKILDISVRPFRKFTKKKNIAPNSNPTSKTSLNSDKDSFQVSNYDID